MTVRVIAPAIADIIGPGNKNAPTIGIQPDGQGIEIIGEGGCITRPPIGEKTEEMVRPQAYRPSASHDFRRAWRGRVHPPAAWQQPARSSEQYRR